MGEVTCSPLFSAPPCPQRPLGGAVCFPIRSQSGSCLPPHSVGFLKGRGSFTFIWKAVTLGI